ncbi:transketolase, partial [Vibrio parahaemolyticus 50]
LLVQVRWFRRSHHRYDNIR